MPSRGQHVFHRLPWSALSEEWICSDIFGTKPCSLVRSADFIRTQQVSQMKFFLCFPPRISECFTYINKWNLYTLGSTGNSKSVLAERRVRDSLHMSQTISLQQSWKQNSDIPQCSFTFQQKNAQTLVLQVTIVHCNTVFKKGSSSSNWAIWTASSPPPPQLFVLKWLLLVFFVFYVWQQMVANVLQVSFARDPTPSRQQFQNCFPRYQKVLLGPNPTGLCTSSMHVLPVPSVSKGPGTFPWAYCQCQLMLGLSSKQIHRWSFWGYISPPVGSEAFQGRGVGREQTWDVGR